MSGLKWTKIKILQERTILTSKLGHGLGDEHTYVGQTHAKSTSTQNYLDQNISTCVSIQKLLFLRFSSMVDA